MSLTDLKKSKVGKIKRKNFTVDEFISDAEDYAKGQPKIVSGDQLNLEQAIVLAKHRAENRATGKSDTDADSETSAENELSKANKTSSENKLKRHATFTLSEDAIEQLQLLATETNLAKSHIIRILINELCNEEQQEKLAKLLKSEVD